MTLFNLGIAHFTAHTLCIMQHKSTDTSDLVVGSQSDSCDAPGTSGCSTSTVHADHSNDEEDSDATTLNSEVRESSSSEESMYEIDPDYKGPISQSQPGQKHGASYTPPGWKKVYKKRNLFHGDC